MIKWNGEKMAVYKISGTTTEEAVIYIIQDEEYKGKRRIHPGKYEMIFESESTSGILAVAENIDGKIMSFGNVTPVEAAGEIPNLSTSRVMSNPANIDDILSALNAVIYKLDTKIVTGGDDPFISDISDQLISIFGKIEHL